MSKLEVTKMLFFDNVFDFSQAAVFSQNLPFESKILFIMFSYKVFFINLTGV